MIFRYAKIVNVRGKGRTFLYTPQGVQKPPYRSFPHKKNIGAVSYCTLKIKRKVGGGVAEFREEHLNVAVFNVYKSCTGTLPPPRQSSSQETEVDEYLRVNTTEIHPSKR
jgi:hypothetical protein